MDVMKADRPMLALFGAYELRLDTGELYKDGAAIRLQRRSFQFLQALLERQGDVVTRDELRARLWADGTFVDFESGLNTAVNRLRNALADSADAPLYVETVARLGYRFIAPVTFFSAEKRSAIPSPKTHVRRLPTWPWRLIGFTTVILVALIWLGSSVFSRQRPPAYRQITFAPGYVVSARFLPDGKRVAYHAISHGNLSGTFVDGQPREWAKDDARVKTVLADGWHNLEFPAGRQIYRTQSIIDCVRVSPSGDQVAFLEHPILDDDGGKVMIAGGSNPEPRVLSSGWESVHGLAWDPSGKEVWFTAATVGVDRKLQAVNMRGQTRQVAEMPGGMVLHDIGANGDALISRPSAQVTMLRGSLHDKNPQNISLLGWSAAVAISPDGNSTLFYESGEGGGHKYSVYIHRADTNSTERIGDGRAIDLSPDGQWVLTQKADDPASLNLISLKDHKTVPVKTNGVAYRWARFLPDNNCLEIVAGIADRGQAERLVRQEVPNGKPLTIVNDLQMSSAIVDGSGRWVAGLSQRPEMIEVDLKTKSVTRRTVEKMSLPIAIDDGGDLIVGRPNRLSILLETLDLASGKKDEIRQIPVNDPTGIAHLHSMFLARDRETFVCSLAESTSTLYLVSGWS